MNYSHKADEYNFDGLVGPTHNYAGLSFGNIASVKNKKKTAYPRKAALQGLEKMKLLMDKGFKQGIFPPHERPAIYFLKQLGFTGSDEQILKSAWSFSPDLLAACYSSSSMWAANCATVSPSTDTKDQKVHFTPSNLQFFLHRYLESDFSAHMLKKFFLTLNILFTIPLSPPVLFCLTKGRLITIVCVPLTLTRVWRFLSMDVMGGSFLQKQNISHPVKPEKLHKSLFPVINSIQKEQ